MEIEQRKQARKTVNWRGVILPSDDARTVPIPVRIRNIGGSGLGVESPQNLAALSHPVRLLLQLPPADSKHPPDTVQLKVRVKYSVLVHTEFQVGMEIVAYLGEARQILEKHGIR